MTLAAAFLILALLVIYAAAVWQVWLAPFRALGVLVAGMAFHNFVLMVLLRLETKASIVRVVQAWKEGILLLLFVLAAFAAFRAWRAGRLPRLNPFDLVVLAFAALAVAYTLIPQHILHGSANLTQRVLGLRELLLLPLLYAYGRIFQPRRWADLLWVGWTILGASALVGLFGLIELWYVPTTTWFSWGVNQLSSWLGFVYNGPFGLPANFFQTTSEGLLLRRMVSTYVSPLGIAYAGLVILPMAIVFISGVRGWRRTLACVLTALLLAGILFSLTRLALLMTVAELFMLAVIMRKRWVLYTTPVVGALALFMIFQYVNVGPLLNRHLQPIVNRPSHMRITSTGDPSLNEHASFLGYDLRYVAHHPLGAGVGSSVHRFGSSLGTVESAVFDVFGDLGVLGGLLYLAMYAGAFFIGVFAYFRVRHEPLLAMLPAVAAIGSAGLAPITLTSDVWGDFATTFLLWWAAGASVTLFLQSRPILQEIRLDRPPPSAPGTGRDRTSA